MNIIGRFFRERQVTGERRKFSNPVAAVPFALKRPRLIPNKVKAVAKISRKNRQEMKAGRDFQVDCEKSSITFNRIPDGTRKIHVTFEYLGKSQFREYFESIVVAAIVAFGIIRPFFVQAFKIPSESMVETLLKGDHLLVIRCLYGTKIPFTEKRIWKIREPRHGDIIVFTYPVDPGKDFIKRCIGCPGDKIALKNNALYRNDVLIDEPYVHLMPVPGYNANYGPVTVPANCYLMLGDNRDNSSDSRVWGFLDYKFIKGKAIFIYWPPWRVQIIN